MKHTNKSLNNRVLVEPYKKTELKAEVRNGMAMISQKVNLKGLKLMADADLTVQGCFVCLKAGDILYFREDQLHMAPGIKDVLSADVIDGPFIILDASLVQFAREVREEMRWGTASCNLVQDKSEELED